MAITLNPFTPSVSVNDTDLISDTDDKIRTVLDEAETWLETEGQSAVDQMETSVNNKISEADTLITDLTTEYESASSNASASATSATNALSSENKAKKWADEVEDTQVETGKYSARHWAAKAEQIVSGGIIDDDAQSTLTVYSSSKTEERLDDVSETLPIVDFSRVESYVAEDGTRWLKNYGKGADGEMLSGQMLEFEQISGARKVFNIPQVSATALTICFDFKADSYTKIIMNTGTGVHFDTTKIRLQTAGFTTFTFGTLDDGLFHRCVLTTDGVSVSSIYIDGEVKETWNDVISFPTAGDIRLGSNVDNENLVIGNFIEIGHQMTSDDIALDYAQPELLCGVSTNTIQSPFSFDTNDILACFPLQEGTMGGGSTWDIKSGTSYPITNYATTMWTNADNLPYGIQQALLVKDDVSNYVTGITLQDEISTIEIDGKGIIDITNLTETDSFNISFAFLNEFPLSGNHYFFDIFYFNAGIFYFDGTALNTALTEDVLYKFASLDFDSETKFLTFKIDGTEYYKEVYSSAFTISSISSTTSSYPSNKMVGLKIMDRSLKDFEYNNLRSDLKDNATSLSLV